MKELHEWISINRRHIEEIDTIGSLLTQKRHRLIHRRFEPPVIRRRFRYKTVSQPKAKINEFIVPWYDAQLTDHDKKKISEIIKQNLIEIKTILPIDDDKKIDMEEACTTLLIKLKELVNETQKRFPLSNDQKS